MLNDEGLEKELRTWPRICFIFHDKNKHGLTLSDIDKSQRELPPQSDLDLEGREKTESVSHVFEQYRRSGISPVTYVCHKMAFSVYFLPCLNKRPNKPFFGNPDSTEKSSFSETIFFFVFSF